MRTAKYYKNMNRLDLDKEFVFLKNEPRAFAVLKALSMEQKNLSDKHMCIVAGMSINTYQKWKSHLVMVGLLQIRQLNATSYFYSLGESAVEEDDLMHDEKDYEALVAKVFSLSLIDDPKSDQNIVISNHYISPEDEAMMEKIEADYPMPSTDDIVDSF